MHFHTGTEDQCPEAHYISLTRENVRVDVFMCPQPLSTHPPTHTHHDALQDLIANSTNSTEAMSKRLYKCYMAHFDSYWPAVVFCGQIFLIMECLFVGRGYLH